MTSVVDACWKVFKVGGWAPVLVFATHAIIGGVLDAYQWWPPIDVPMHFAGGLSMAFFISRSFQALPRPMVPRGRLAILELLLVVSLTATAAVFWEFGEFFVDRVVGVNVQIGLANTIKDMALGIGGSVV